VTRDCAASAYLDGDGYVARLIGACWRPGRNPTRLSRRREPIPTAAPMGAQARLRRPLPHQSPATAPPRSLNSVRDAPHGFVPRHCGRGRPPRPEGVRSRRDHPCRRPPHIRRERLVHRPGLSRDLAAVIHAISAPGRDTDAARLIAEPIFRPPESSQPGFTSGGKTPAQMISERAFLLVAGTGFEPAISGL
jgi:hypothetical protein